MASKKAGNDKGSVTTVGRLVADQEWALVRSALDKIHLGNSLTNRELAAYKRWNAAQREAHVQEFIRAIPQKKYRSWCDVKDAKTIYKHCDLYGFPVRGKTIDVTAVVRHLHNFLVDKGSVLQAKASAVAEADSEIQRQRAAKADILEMERDEKRGTLLPRSLVHDMHVRFAARLRKAADSLGRRFGAEAQRVLADALDDCERFVNDTLGGNDP